MRSPKRITVGPTSAVPQTLLLDNMGFPKYLVASLSFAAGVLSSPVASTPGYGAPTYGNGSVAISPNPRNGHWVDTWTSMPQLTEFANLPPPPFVSGCMTRPHIDSTDGMYRMRPTSSSTTPPFVKPYV